MSWVTGSNIAETSTTTGTGTFTLAGALHGSRAFSAIAGDGDQVMYEARLDPPGEWEIGRGTWRTGGTLERTTVLASSQAGGLVNFSSGTKKITSPGDQSSAGGARAQDEKPDDGEAALGQLWLDSTSGALYRCTQVEPQVVWTKLADAEPVETLEERVAALEETVRRLVLAIAEGQEPPEDLIEDAVVATEQEI